MPNNQNDNTDDTDQSIVANGVNGATGEYLWPPQTEQQAAEIASVPPVKEQLNILRGVSQQFGQPHLGAPFDVDLSNPKDAGWAIVFHADEDPAVKAALQPLIDHRHQRVGNDKIVKVLEYRDGDTIPQWLARYRMGIGDIDPEKIPYYLLLIGSPGKIPFLFGHLLDAVYGVGRLSFDTAAEYSAYVNSVLVYETAPSIANSRDVFFFGPRHIADKPTRLSANALVKPLAGGDPDQLGVLDRLAKSKFKVSYNGHYLPPEGSTKQALHDVFCPGLGKLTPSLLFTASHGVGWPLGGRASDEHSRCLALSGFCRFWIWPHQAGPVFRRVRSARRCKGPGNGVLPLRVLWHRHSERRPLHAQRRRSAGHDRPRTILFGSSKSLIDPPEWQRAGGDRPRRARLAEFDYHHRRRRAIAAFLQLSELHPFRETAGICAEGFQRALRLAVRQPRCASGEEAFRTPSIR